MSEPETITHEDLDRLNSGLSPKDRNYFTGLDDPRLAALSQDESFQRLVRNLKAVRKNEQIRISRAEIDSVLEKAIADSKQKTPLKRKEEKISDYVSREKQRIRFDSRTRMNEEPAIRKLEVEVRNSAIETANRAPTADFEDVFDAFKAGEKRHTEQVRLEDELAKRDAEIAKLMAIRDAGLALIRGYVGEKHASKIVDLPDSLKKILTFFKARQGQESDAARLFDQFANSGQELIRQFFLAFGLLKDPSEEATAYGAFGAPVRKLLSSEGVEVTA